VPWITAVGATQDDGVFNLAITVNAPGGIAGNYVALEGAGLAPTRNLGILHHEDGSGEIARTILDIDARP
jgi:hypothetical protein